MEQPILVAHASEFGSTAEIAGVLGEELRSAGASVDVRPIVDVEDVRPYGAAVIGSAVYNGTWLPEAVHFVRVHAPALKQIPVAYFVVCATMRDDTADHREGARSFLEPVLTGVPAVQPVESGLFAGRIDTRNVSIPIRLRMRLTTRLRSGDYRDWDAIRAWARRLPPVLAHAGAPHV